MGALDDELRTFDPIDPSLSASLWETLRQAQRHCPTFRSDQYGGFVALTRYDDVVQAADDHFRLFSGLGIGPVPPENDFRFIMLESDPPYHRGLRRLLNPYFSAAAALRYETQVRAQVNDLIDGFVGRGSCEFVSEFAIPLPSRVVFEDIIGAPREGLPRVLSWLVVIVTDPVHSGEAHDALTQWAAQLLDERAVAPRRDDMMDALLHGTVDERPLTLDERANLLGLMLLGAIDNTANTLAAIAYLLATRPDLVAQLQAGGTVLDRAVEEFLRIEPSVPSTARTAVSDLEVGGTTVRAGERVLLYWGAANRDPAHFADPAEIRFDRARNDHLSFGHGVHRCIGRHFARLEVRVALEQILRRMPHLALQAGAEVHVRHGLSRGFERLPLTFDRGEV